MTMEIVSFSSVTATLAAIDLRLADFRGDEPFEQCPQERRLGQFGRGVDAQQVTGKTRIGDINLSVMDQIGGQYAAHQNAAAAAPHAAFSPLGLPEGNSAVHPGSPASALGGPGLAHSMSQGQTGLAQPVMPGDLKNLLPSNPLKLSTVVSAARESAFDFIWDPIAISLVK